MKEGLMNSAQIRYGISNFKEDWETLSKLSKVKYIFSALKIKFHKIASNIFITGNDHLCSLEEQGTEINNQQTAFVNNIFHF